MGNRDAGNPRAWAYAALLDWENTSSYAHDLLERHARNGAGRADTALSRELLFGVLRNLYFLDAIIERFRTRGNLKLGVRCLLRLGLYQIFRTEIADHAAVNETVSLARKHERPIVNAILRNALRDRDRLEQEMLDWSMEDYFSHPAWLIERWCEQHGEEAAVALCEWNNRPPDTFARIHDRASYEERIAGRSVPKNPATSGQARGSGLPEAVAGADSFVRLPPGPLPMDWIEAGIIYIQDPSTRIAPELLCPAAEEVILDACAAPGGKTALLAAAAPPDTTIWATDSNPARIRLMEENLGRLGLERIHVREVDWARPCAKQLRDLPHFDAILLDVPCSNTGVMRRRVDVRWRLQPGDFDQLTSLQIKLLKNTLPFLKPGGRIIYSTCSIDTEENRTLAESCGLRTEEIRDSLPWRDGFDGAFAACLRPG